MPRKLGLILIMGVLLVSACSPTTPTPTQAPTDAVTQEPAEPTSDTAEETETGPIAQGETMPCSTVYEYETTAETEQYQQVAGGEVLPSNPAVLHNAHIKFIGFHHPSSQNTSLRSFHKILDRL